MAVLKGFPPSNTISTCQPVKHICGLCDKEFWASFPSHLKFGRSDSIVGCFECVEKHDHKHPDMDKNEDDPDYQRWFKKATVYYADKEDLLTKLEGLRVRVGRHTYTYICDEPLHDLVWPEDYYWNLYYRNFIKGDKSEYKADCRVYGSKGRIFVTVRPMVCSTKG